MCEIQAERQKLLAGRFEGDVANPSPIIFRDMTELQQGHAHDWKNNVVAVPEAHPPAYLFHVLCSTVREQSIIIIITIIKNSWILTVWLQFMFW